MFGLKLEGKVGSIAADVKTDDGAILRIDKGNLHFEFTKEFASALGQDAATVQGLLRGEGWSGASKALDNGKFKIQLTDGSESYETEGGGKQEPTTIEVIATHGKMTFKAPNKEDANPQATLTAIFPTKDESHMWWVHHQQESVDVVITKVEEQTKVPGAE